MLEPEASAARPGVLRFYFRGDPHKLLTLQTAIAVYQVSVFAVPRPRALLGDASFRRLVADIDGMRQLHPPGTFCTLGVGAAGADSPVMQRLHEHLGAALSLECTQGQADLLLRIRRATGGVPGWEVLMRLSPRPLSARSWRVCDWPGALNATVAQAMARLTRPTPHDVFLNLCCGSATVLIERTHWGAAGRLVGCDTSPVALACARANLQASGCAGMIELTSWDARTLPLPDASIDALAADLPFGFATGSHAENIEVYPGVLCEAARVAKAQARFVVLTHELKLFDSLVQASAQWTVEQRLRIRLRMLEPALYVLSRT